MELHTLNKVILRSLYYLKVASFKLIIKVDCSNLSRNYSYSVSFLWLVLIISLLCNGIDTRHKVINLHFTAVSSSYSLVYTVACDSEVQSVNLSVLTGLNNLARTVADFHLHITADRVVYFLSVRYQVLNR